MATSVTEINSIFLPSEIPFSKNFSHKNQSTMVMITDLRSYDYETIDLHFSSIDYKTQFQSVQITLNLTG